ncbi:hypothetical protein Taro_018684 [Colocasia esculenta]|uniref:RNase H type-1 domain-containing protein n=1 Tax=Colocasia esculenta TaxID=4460 RepID=A0A843UWY7_COLES|nr:hypothetical protein [Colocasia esculenta]
MDKAIVSQLRPTLSMMKIPQHWLATLHQNASGQENLQTRIPRIIPWLTPPLGRLKLNVDGTFKMTSGEAGGGGILRDHEGKMCWAFARAYHGLKSSLAAKALALRDGLSICCSKGITEVLVETDSLNLLQIVTKQISCPWDFACIMQHIATKKQELEAEISHTPREANRVADCLASFAMSCPHVVIWDYWPIYLLLLRNPTILIRLGILPLGPNFACTHSLFINENPSLATWGR